VTVVSDRDTSGKTRQTDKLRDDDHTQPGARLAAVVRLLIPIVVALAIFAHGCHTGDHDDEPSVAPRVHDQEPPR
jgi:hypothetical protein